MSSASAPEMIAGALGSRGGSQEMERTTRARRGLPRSTCGATVFAGIPTKPASAASRICRLELKVSCPSTRTLISRPPRSNSHTYRRRRPAVGFLVVVVKFPGARHWPVCKVRRGGHHRHAEVGADTNGEHVFWPLAPCTPASYRSTDVRQTVVHRDFDVTSDASEQQLYSARGSFRQSAARR
jgi:hypothetical protein